MENSTFAACFMIYSAAFINVKSVDKQLNFGDTKMVAVGQSNTSACTAEKVSTQSQHVSTVKLLSVAKT